MPIRPATADAIDDAAAALREGRLVAFPTETVYGLGADATNARAVAAVLGRSLMLHSGDVERPSSPGQLASHYAPRTPVRLNASSAHPGEAFLAFGPVVADHDGPSINLSPSGDLIEAAANLFAALRQLDAAGAVAIAVMPIPEAGLGEAINDRLRRAAVR